MTGEKAEAPGRAMYELLTRARTGTLASLNRDDGAPYASLVNVAQDGEGFPLFLFSTLAWHTKNLTADPRCALLVAELPDRGDVLTGSRITIMGRLEPVFGAAALGHYLARHPEAEGYARFGDFGLFRLVPERVHAVAGFGRIETLPAAGVFPSLAKDGA